MNRQPPKLAERFLAFYCKNEFQEEILGDLYERFESHVDKYGIAKAKRLYWLNIFKFIRGYRLKVNANPRYSTNNIMVKNYLKIAFRNVARHKAYSFINIAGLMVGLTSFILISMYTQHQLGFDKFHENKEYIYRITDGEKAFVPSVVGALLERSFEDEIVESARLIVLGSRTFKVKQETYMANVHYMEPSFLRMFSFPLLYGDKEQAFNNPYSLVISEKEAIAHFGKSDVMGETLTIFGRTYTITGVFAPIPKQSLIQMDYAVQMSDVPWTTSEDWTNDGYYTYVQLAPGVDVHQFETKADQFINTALKEQIGGKHFPILLQNFGDIYLQSEMRLQYEIGKPGNIKYVYIFMAVAVLILLIACVNYVNLATARAMHRAKEVGVRKVVGAQRQQLISQFLSESFVFVFGALILSFGLATLLLPYFNVLADQTFGTADLTRTEIIFQLIILGLIITVLAGAYPALMLSNFKPVAVLKGKFSSSSSGNGLRRVLVIFQFSISAFLIVATLVVNKQLSYIQNKNLGFDKDHVVRFATDPWAMRDQMGAFKNNLLSNPNIEHVGLSQNTPVFVGSTHPLKIDEFGGVAPIYCLYTDEDFINAVGFDLIAGTDFNSKRSVFWEYDTTDHKPSYIINETAAKLFNWSAEEAVGQNITIAEVEAPVQGVIKDFHFMSMEHEIEPFVLLYNPSRIFYGFAKISGSNMRETISHIESTLGEFAPDLPFDLKFLDDRFQQLYSFELRLKRVFITFASIAILIACLGMFGLVSFMASNRSKEIGIRKVLGASISSMMLLISKDFLTLIGIALLIGLPLSYYFMNEWLLDYQYRIHISWTLLAVAGISALAVSLVTITYQTIKTARINPSQILRNE